MENSYYNQSALNSFYLYLGNKLCTALSNKELCELIVNDNGSVYLDYGRGNLEAFESISTQQANLALRALASAMHINFDANMPILSCSIPKLNGRLEGLLPPLVKNASFCIRLHHKSKLCLDELVAMQFLTKAQACLLQQLLLQKRSMLIVGPTGCGKTTFLNALLYELASLCPKERIILIEDSPEIKVSNNNCLSLMARDQNSLSCLIKSSLRLRPDRIVLGEVRGAEALDLLDAFASGHDGSFATMHASNIDTALHRLSLLVSRHHSAPRYIEQTIAYSLDLILIIKAHPKRALSSIVKIKDFKQDQFFYEILGE